MRYKNLPDSIRLKTGETLKPVIGGHLELTPFLTIVDVKKNGWIVDLPPQGNSRNITFDAWLAEMADNDNGILTYAARMFIEETATAIGNTTRRIVPMMESEETHA